MEVSQVIQAGIKGSIAHPESAELIIDLLETDIATIQDLEDYVNVDGSSTLEKIKLDTNPTLPPLVAGDIYYDTESKTVAAKVTEDTTIKISQDETFLAYNIVPTTILKGQVVYVTGVISGQPRVQLARADIITENSIIGLAAEDIPFNTTGLIQTRGNISGLDTDEFFTNSTVYLSPSVLGGLSSSPPTSSTDFQVAIGYILISNATTGTIFINLNQSSRLADLSDVEITAPIVDQVLRYNGAYWINGSETSTSASVGANFFLDNSIALPAGSGPQSIEAFSLVKNPSATAENIHTAVVNNSTALIKFFIYPSFLGGTSIDSGNWRFNTNASVSQATGTTTLPIVVRKIVAQAGSVTVMGIGTTRTVTANSSTPFSAADYNADPTLATYIQTPNALFRIIGFISNISVSVETLSTYTNEITVAYSKHINLFEDTPIEINSTTVELISSETARTSYPINATDKLSVAYYAKTTALVNTTVSLYLNGIDNASYFITPIATRHNDLIGLQGGSSTELYHMTLNEYNVLLNTSGINTGDQDLSTFEVHSNKSTSLPTDQASNTKYPSVKAVFDYVTDTFQTDLGYTPENAINKATDLTSPDDFKYPTTQAVATAIGALAPGGVTSFNTRTGAVMPVPGDYSKTDVGLAFVDNTSDLNKPVSTAQANAIGVVQDDLTTHKGTYTNPHNVTKTQVGLGNVDNTSDANKPVSTATQTALNAKQDTIVATTAADYYRGDKTFQPLNKTAVGLNNVVNADTTTTVNIADSLNKRFVTDTDLAKLANTSGVNSGDQDLSVLVPKTTTVNGYALSSNVTITKSDVGLSNVVNLDTTTTANITDSLNKRFATDAQLSALASIGQYFETVSKNLKSYPYVLNYTTGTLTSIVYDIGGGNFITKTLNYTTGTLTSIVLSGTLPVDVTSVTKTLTYTTGTLTSVSYS